MGVLAGEWHGLEAFAGAQPLQGPQPLRRVGRGTAQQFVHEAAVPARGSGMAREARKGGVAGQGPAFRIDQEDRQVQQFVGGDVRQAGGQAHRSASDGAGGMGSAVL
jgi:hypothetical protein